MEDNKICFIACTNNETYETEMLRYIRHLEVPEGYAVDALCVHDARSMTAGYNEGMNASDAKYKVYLHQDTFIVNKFFLRDTLAVFREQEIGMLGMVGAPHMPENAIMWESSRVGKLYYNDRYQAMRSEMSKIAGAYAEVEAVDGFLMMTQYDLPWREDLFDKWDFYDASQSFEFRRKGYRVVVPRQEEPWCLHDDGLLDLKNYYGERLKFKKEYMQEELP